MVCLMPKIQIQTLLTPYKTAIIGATSALSGFFGLHLASKISNHKEIQNSTFNFIAKKNKSRFFVDYFICISNSWYDDNY